MGNVGKSTPGGGVNRQNQGAPAKMQRQVSQKNLGKVGKVAFEASAGAESFKKTLPKDGKPMSSSRILKKGASSKSLKALNPKPGPEGSKQRMELARSGVKKLLPLIQPKVDKGVQFQETKENKEDAVATSRKRQSTIKVSPEERKEFFRKIYDEKHKSTSKLQPKKQAFQPAKPSSPRGDTKIGERAEINKEVKISLKDRSIKDSTKVFFKSSFEDLVQSARSSFSTSIEQISDTLSSSWSSVEDLISLTPRSSTELESTSQSSSTENIKQKFTNSISNLKSHLTLQRSKPLENYKVSQVLAGDAGSVKLSPKTQKEVSRAFQAEGYEYSDQMAIGVLNKQNLVGDMKLLGSGVVNEVFVGTFSLPDGTEREFAFKPEESYGQLPSKMIPGEVDALDIPFEQSQVTHRNVATYQVNELFFEEQGAQGVITPTEVGVFNGKMGTAMALAPGDPGQIEKLIDLNDSDQASVEDIRKNIYELGPDYAEVYIDQYGSLDAAFSAKLNESGFKLGKDGSIKKMEMQVLSIFEDIDATSNVHDKLNIELQKLQILDAIMAQGDRHEGNYYIKVKGSFDNPKVSLQGIDNDVCMGRLVGDKITFSDFSKGVSGQGKVSMLPVKVDPNVADLFFNVSDDALRERLDGFQFDKEEVDAAVSRFQEIKTHLQKVKNAGGHLEDDSGNKLSVTPKNSYYERLANTQTGLKKVRDSA